MEYSHEGKDDLQSISDKEFDDKLLKSGKPFIVEFGAEWCGVCHIMDPVIKQLLVEYEGRVEFFKINVDDHDITSKRYGIIDLPTLLFFRDGEIIDHIIGAVPKKVLQDIFKKIIN